VQNESGCHSQPEATRYAMKISDHIKHSLDSADKKDLNQAMLFACLAIDGTSKKVYPNISWVGERFRKFINENLAAIMRRAEDFSMFVRHARGVDPSGWIGVDRLAVQHVRD
jgi:hypothetical protein